MMREWTAPFGASWFRVSLLLCSALLRGQREVGVGAHSLTIIQGCEFNSSAVGEWTFVRKWIYDGEVISYFDPVLRRYVAVKEWMQSNVDRWNKEDPEAVYQDLLGMCGNNIPIYERVVLPRRVEPEVTVQPKVSSHAGQSALLTCHVTGFYPSEIEVKWLKNGAPAPNGAISTVLLSDGDWTYQVEELLQYHPVSGDVYTCHVEHISLNKPKTVDWEVQSSPESERTKIIVGALGFVFGLVILLAGVIMKLKNAKAILDSAGPGPRLMGPAIR